MMLNEKIRNEVESIAKKAACEKLVAKTLIDNYIRNNKFNSATRNKVTDYFFNCIRYYGLLSENIDITDKDSILQSIEQYEFNESFAAKIIGVDNYISQMIYNNLDKTSFLSFLTRAPLTIRVNSIKTTREFLAYKYNFFEKTKVSPFGLFTNKHINVRQFEEFKKGLFEIQDEASQLIYFLVNPKYREKILDLCAGTGGKSLLLNSTGVNPDIHAYDISPARLNILKKRAKILNQNIKILNKPSGKFEKVLIDAPCSGSGSMRRDVDVLLRLDKSKIKSLMITQKNLFEKAYNLTEKGGYVIYVTCSFFAEENEMQVEYFLNNFNVENVKVSTIFDSHINTLLKTDTFYKTNPLKFNMDGFFAAVFKVL